MNIDELNSLLTTGENTRIEFKEARETLPGSFYQTVVSFLNREGGVIILGAADNGSLSGINISCLEQLKKEMVTALNNNEIINPPVNFPVYQLQKEEKTVVCLKVPVSSQIHSFKGVIYDRENDSDIAITDDARISEMYFRKRNNFSESELIRHLRLEDFEPRLFDKARAIVGAANRTHPWVEADNMTILRNSQFYRRDFRTGEEGFTLAAALVFGKDEVIQSILPGYKVDVLVRINDTGRFDDRLAPLRTNLIETYQAVMEFIKTRPYLPEKFYLEGDQRKDLRELIFRELVGNMIVHREYTSAHTTEMVIYSDRVEITNPNKPLFKGILSPDAFSPYAKNPAIRKFFAEFGWTDELGSGVKNVKKYLNIYANGAKPVFIEDDKFRVLIPLTNPVFGERADMVVQFSGLNTDILPDEVMDEMQKLPLFAPLAKISDPDDFLFQKGSGWTEKGVKLRNARINKINNLQFDDFKKGSSWAEKGVKLLPKRTLVILKVLMICLLPAKVEDMKQILSFGSRDKLRELYLNPLRKDGLIEITIKDKPNSPEQKYILTEKGRLFLGGFEMV